MAKYYFTFGVGHPRYGKTAAVVEVVDGPGSRGRAITMFQDRFGTGYCTEYSESEWRSTEMAGSYTEVGWLELEPVKWDPFG